MAYMNDEIFDQGLDYADAYDSGTVTVHICSADPGSAAPVTNVLGTKTSVTIDAPGNSSSGTGRSVQTSSITNGSIATGGTASHWSITNSANTVCLASGSLASTTAVSAGNTFSLDPIELFIRDATSV